MQTQCYTALLQGENERADEGMRKGDLKPFWIRYQPLLRGQLIQAVRPRRIGTHYLK